MADGNFETAGGPGAAFPSDTLAATSMLLRIVPDFERIDGWLKLDVSELLFAAAASIKTGCIVEIGSYRGRSTVALCAGSSTGAKIPVFAIEPHEHFVGAKGGIFGPNDRKAFFKTILTTKFSSLVRLINTTSMVVAAGWEKPVSLLFIDGDHRYEAVLSDFSAWRPHLVDGAIVIFHDATGTGTGLLIKDLIHDAALLHIQTVGRLAMFRFNAVDGHVDRRDIPHSGAKSVYPIVSTATASTGPRDAQLDHNLYYSARGDYLYQPIPQCGGRVIKTALLELECLTVDPNPTKRHNKKLNQFPGTEQLTASNVADLFAGRTETFKFAFVRDPYARLARAYTDKIAPSHNWQSDHWIEHIRHAAVRHGITLSETISFEEFVKVVSTQSVEEMDIRWRPQYHCGRFDTIKFDYIGRTELISTDFGYVLERLEAPSDLAHRAIQSQNVSTTNLSIWSLVGGDVRAAFLKTFAIDFDTLRYPMRHAGVLFRPVNIDRPKSAPFTLPTDRSDKTSKRLNRNISVQAKSDVPEDINAVTPTKNRAHE